MVGVVHFWCLGDKLMWGLSLSYPLVIAFLGSILLGISSGILSCYATLRQHSLLSDTIAHASLPGICIVFLFTFTKQPLFLFFGAFLSGLLGVWLMGVVVRTTILKTDTVMGLVLALFFGFGVFLLTIIQKYPVASQAGLETYLFGSAATLLVADIYLLLVCFIVIFCSVMVFWKEFKCFIFDAQYYMSLGFSVKRTEFLLMVLMVLTIVMGLQLVGVVLISALMIAPAIVARQWTDRLSIMMIIAVSVSVLAASFGVYVSSLQPHLSTGPLIVVVVSIIAFLSLFFAPKHGQFFKLLRQKFFKKEIHDKLLLQYMFYLARTHRDYTRSHDVNTLKLVDNFPAASNLTRLAQQKLIYHDHSSYWGLTRKGYLQAKAMVETNEYM